MVESRCGILCGSCTYREETGCTGCTKTENPFWGECAVKKCCEGRRLLHCGQCGEFPCARLRQFAYDAKWGNDGACIRQCECWRMEDKKRLEGMAEELLSRCGEVILSSVSGEGYPRSCVLAKIAAKGYQDIYLATAFDSVKVSHFRKNPKAGLCYYKGGDSVASMGTVEVLTDQETKNTMWQDWFIQHFPLGKEDPNYCILHFKGETATLWIQGIFVTF